MRIFVIRHGETESNQQGLIQGNIDSRLTPLGVRQSQLIAEELKGADIDFIFSSPASRARQTAQPLAIPRSLPIAIVPGLREREYGIYEGKTLQEIKSTHPELFATGSEKIDLDAKPKDGESLREVAGRVVPFVDRLKAHLKNQTVAIVAHGIVNKIIIGELIDCSLENIGAYRQSNACINEILFKKGKGKLIRLDYTGHLKF